MLCKIDILLYVRYVVKLAYNYVLKCVVVKLKGTVSLVCGLHGSGERCCIVR